MEPLLLVASCVTVLLFGSRVLLLLRRIWKRRYELAKRQNWKPRSELANPQDWHPRVESVDLLHWKQLLETGLSIVLFIVSLLLLLFSIIPNETGRECLLLVAIGSLTCYQYWNACHFTPKFTSKRSERILHTLALILVVIVVTTIVAVPVLCSKRKKLLEVWQYISVFSWILHDFVLVYYFGYLYRRYPSHLKRPSITERRPSITERLYSLIAKLLRYPNHKSPHLAVVKLIWWNRFFGVIALVLHLTSSLLFIKSVINYESSLWGELAAAALWFLRWICHYYKLHRTEFNSKEPTQTYPASNSARRLMEFPIEQETIPPPTPFRWSLYGDEDSENLGSSHFSAKMPTSIQAAVLHSRTCITNRNTLPDLRIWQSHKHYENLGSSHSSAKMPTSIEAAVLCSSMGITNTLPELRICQSHEYSGTHLGKSGYRRSTLW